jgi:hypothetical protein
MNCNCKSRESNKSDKFEFDKNDIPVRWLVDKNWFNRRWVDEHYSERDWFHKNWTHRHKSGK